MGSNALLAASFSPSLPTPSTGTPLGGLKKKFLNNLEADSEIQPSTGFHGRRL
jgi:hypothetical protein